LVSEFRTPFGETIFRQKYAHEGCETWAAMADTVVEDVCRDYVSADTKREMKRAIREFKFIPGGRYLRNAGRELKYFSNCFALKAEEDTREDWAELSKRVELCLGSGGGIGVDYSVYRPRGAFLKRTGGVASGPVSKMKITNEQGRELMQGGARRSAIYGSLRWNHADAPEFLHCKDWHLMKIPGTDITYADAKAADFNFPCPLDHTNISLNYDDDWLNLPERHRHPTFLDNVRQALSTGEPGFSFNFGEQRNHTLRNACTEFITDEDSDSCNLASVVMCNHNHSNDFAATCALAAQFLLCGTITGHVPYDKVREVRERNRRIGVGLMGVHEWLLQRGKRYECDDEMYYWLSRYSSSTRYHANKLADALSIPRPKAVQSIAPTGTIGSIAGTTTGIEPIYAVALKRRYLKNGTEWCYQYVIDATAQLMIDRYGLDPERIETAADLAKDFERRIAFQADVQDYVDMGISSTINLPAWGSEHNNEDTVAKFAETLSKYAPRLRGFTAYPDGARGGQPLVAVPYAEAEAMVGVELREHESCKGGVCGI
jgi:ribonucleoside-diphosphate reductase alpha chain